jgi:hypothetical protein
MSGAAITTYARGFEWTGVRHPDPHTTQLALAVKGRRGRYNRFVYTHANEDVTRPKIWHVCKIYPRGTQNKKILIARY